MNDVFDGYDEQPLDVGGYVLAPTSVFDFDVLVVGGNDSRRINAAYHRHACALRGRLVISLMKGSTPAKRADLLLTGFDDAIEIEKVTPEEGVARISSMYQRYHNLAVRQQADNRHQRLLASYCLPSDLSRREHMVMDLLLKSEGKHVSAHSLRNAISQSHEPISVGNLRVTISKLRQKLTFGVRLLSDGKGFYYLDDNR